VTVSHQLDHWILQQRPLRNAVDSAKPYAFLLEQENFGPGRIAEVATIFLTNRECPWRCLMCDLWKNTLTESVQPGAIPAQIDFALSELEGVASKSLPNSPLPALSPHPMRGEGGRRPGEGCDHLSNEAMPFANKAPLKVAGLKLYNSGSFFDPRAIPVEDYPAIAERARQFERVIVECHPALVSERVLRFKELLSTGRADLLVGQDAQQRVPTQLEVAMGLETVHPQVLERLNKRMTLDEFARAAAFLRCHQIALRAFVLVKPPFLTEEAEALHWARRSIDFAFDCGAAVVSLIPTRFGNGALEALATQGQFAPPKLATLEAALDYGLSLGRGRVFADLWDLEKFSDCPACFPQRQSRLHEMNLNQCILPRAACQVCK